MIYFDNAATTRINSIALEDLVSKSTMFFGNASTHYSVGREAKKIIEGARKNIASLLSASPQDVFFTSGGTEANNIILQSIFEQNNCSMHVIATEIEHESILNVLKHFQEKGITFTLLKPNKEGVISAEDVSKAIRPETKLITCQYVNNEVGSVQPISEISKIAASNGIHFHVDAVQAVGHLPINFEELGVTSLAASAHKFGGPKGIGFLISKKHDVGLCYGGGQEKAVKSGTENVPSISSMSVALTEACAHMDENWSKIYPMMRWLLFNIYAIDETEPNVIPSRLSSIFNFYVHGVSNEALVNYLDLKSVCVSTGSACSGATFERSHVLKSLGFSDERIDSSIRISLSPENTMEECEKFIKLLKTAIEKLKE